MAYNRFSKVDPKVREVCKWFTVEMEKERGKQWGPSLSLILSGAQCAFQLRANVTQRQGSIHTPSPLIIEDANSCLFAP